MNPLNYKLLVVGLLVGLVLGTVAGGTALRQVFTRDVPPVAVFAFAPNEIHPGDTVTFNATASRDPDGSIADYSWSFGDETPVKSGSIQNHVYPSTGNFTVTLTVADNNRSVDTRSVKIRVTPRATTVPPIFAGEFVLGPSGTDTGNQYFAVHLSPQQPVTITLVMLSGNFTQNAGVEFVLGSFTTPLVDRTLHDTTPVSITLDSSNQRFVDGIYPIELNNNGIGTIAANTARFSVTIVAA